MVNSSPKEPSVLDLDALTGLAWRLADAASAVSLPKFRALDLATENKEDDGFDPVTEADRGAEAAMRAILSAERPEDGVFGEEEARTHSTSGLTWVLDPIDGTRGYISGVPLWGTLIALDDGEQGRIGVLDQPFTGERFTGILGDTVRRAWLARHGVQRDIAVRRCTGLDRATFFTTDPYLFRGEEFEAFTEVRGRVRLTRYGTDCYAYALLAMGHIDLVIEAGLQAYDIASHVPLVRAAGGIMTDWQGGDCRWGGRTLAAGDPAVHAAALEILSGVA